MQRCKREHFLAHPCRSICKTALKICYCRLACVAVPARVVQHDRCFPRRQTTVYLVHFHNDNEHHPAHRTVHITVHFCAAPNSPALQTYRIFPHFTRATHNLPTSMSGCNDCFWGQGVMWNSIGFPSGTVVNTNILKFCLLSTAAIKLKLVMLRYLK